MGAEFFSQGEKEFSVDSLRQLSQTGDNLVKSHGELHLALRSLQEQKMREQAHLVNNAERWLSDAPALQEDVMQLHHLGAVPTYRGGTPLRNAYVDFPTIPLIP